MLNNFMRHEKESVSPTALIWRGNTCPTENRAVSVGIVPATCWGNVEWGYLLEYHSLNSSQNDAFNFCATEDRAKPYCRNQTAYVTGIEREKCGDVNPAGDKHGASTFVEIRPR